MNRQKFLSGYVREKLKPCYNCLSYHYHTSCRITYVGALPRKGESWKSDKGKIVEIVGWKTAQEEFITDEEPDSMRRLWDWSNDQMTPKIIYKDIHAHHCEDLIDFMNAYSPVLDMEYLIQRAQRFQAQTK